MKSSQTSPGRASFTLVELLVVIAIIGVLVALLLPAIQAAREAARRSQCSNNLKQLGLGFHNFAATNGGFPARRWGPADGGITGWGTFLLPYIEEQAIADRYNWKYDFYDPINKDVVETKLSAFICPSATHEDPDVSSGKATTGSANPDKSTVFSVNGYIDYLAPNGMQLPTTGYGTTFPSWPNSGNSHQAMLDSTTTSSFANGVGRAPRKLKQITDGLSKTLIINETAGWPQHWIAKHIDPNPATAIVSLSNRGSWAGWQTFVYWPTSGDGLQNASANATAGDLLSCSINCENVHQIYGFHPGGALIVLCDGSVRYVSEDLTPIGFAQLVDIDDDQIISDTALQ